MRSIGLDAAHTCRRILQDLADNIFPATSEIRKKGKKEIKLEKKIMSIGSLLLLKTLVILCDFNI